MRVVRDSLQTDTKPEIIITGFSYLNITYLDINLI